MRILAHPLLRRDISGIAEHVLSRSGDPEAARRRVIEIRELLAAVQDQPGHGAPLADTLPGWRMRHGGKGRKILIVYRYDPQDDLLCLALVAFAGQDWTARATDRRQDFPAP